MRTLLLGFLMTMFFLSPVFAGPTGKELYDKSCKACHGIDGKGNARLAQGMKIKPEFLDLAKQETKDKKDEVLKAVVTDGAGKMKGFKDRLKIDEISIVVAHVRTLQEVAK